MRQRRSCAKRAPPVNEISKSLLNWAKKVSASPPSNQQDVCRLVNDLGQFGLAKRSQWPEAAISAFETCLRAAVGPFETQGHLLAIERVLAQQKGLCLLIREPPPEQEGLKTAAAEVLDAAAPRCVHRNEQIVTHCDLQRFMAIPSVPFWEPLVAQGLTMTAEWAGVGPRRRPRWNPVVNLAVVRALEVFYRAGVVPEALSADFLQEVPAVVQASLPFLEPSLQVPAVYCLGRLSAVGAPLHGIPSAPSLGLQAAMVISKALPHLDANVAERTVVALVNLQPPPSGAAAVAAAVAHRAADAAAAEAPPAVDAVTIWKLLELLVAMRVQLGGNAAAAVLSLLEREAQRSNLSLKHVLYICAALPPLGMPTLAPDLLTAMLRSGARSSSRVLRHMVANKTSQRFVRALGPAPAVAAARHIGAAVTSWEGLDEAASRFAMLSDHRGDVATGADHLQGLMASLESAVAEMMAFTAGPRNGAEGHASGASSLHENRPEAPQHGEAASKSAGQVSCTAEVATGHEVRLANPVEQQGSANGAGIDASHAARAIGRDQDAAEPAERGEERRGGAAASVQNGACRQGSAEQHKAHHQKEKGKGGRGRHRVSIDKVAQKVPEALQEWVRSVEAWRARSGAERYMVARKLLEDVRFEVKALPSIAWVGEPAAAFVALVEASTEALREAAEASAQSVSAAERSVDGACRTEADELAAGMTTATSFSRGANGMTVTSLAPESVAEFPMTLSIDPTTHAAACRASNEGSAGDSHRPSESSDLSPSKDAAATGSTSIDSATRLLTLVSHALQTQKGLLAMLREDAAAWAAIRRLVQCVTRLQTLSVDTELIIGVCSLQTVMEETCEGFWEAIMAHSLVATDAKPQDSTVRWSGAERAPRAGPRAVQSLLRLAAHTVADVPQHVRQQLPAAAAATAPSLGSRRALALVYHTAALGTPVGDATAAALAAAAAPALPGLRHEIVVEALERFAALGARLTPELAAALHLHVTAGDPPRSGGRWAALLAATAQLRSAQLRGALAAAAVEGVHVAAVTHCISLAEGTACLRLLRTLGADVPQAAASAVVAAVLAKLLAVLEGYEKSHGGFAAALAECLGLPRDSTPAQIVLAADTRARAAGDGAALVAELGRLSQALDAEIVLHRDSKGQASKRREVGQTRSMKHNAQADGKLKGAPRLGHVGGHNKFGTVRSGSSFAVAVAEAAE
jgi:hypothetical protein